MLSGMKVYRTTSSAAGSHSDRDTPARSGHSSQVTRSQRWSLISATIRRLCKIIQINVNTHGIINIVDGDRQRGEESRRVNGDLQALRERHFAEQIELVHFCTPGTGDQEEDGAYLVKELVKELGDFEHRSVITTRDGLIVGLWRPPERRHGNAQVLYRSSLALCAPSSGVPKIRKTLTGLPTVRQGKAKTRSVADSGHALNAAPSVGLAGWAPSELALTAALTDAFPLARRYLFPPISDPGSPFKDNLEP
ncbi:hypothetical protein MSG28_013790 [Choristoneura fumiferana]|uniref:Uncharacterized protein n=1 Tax=Choristoneura fumiferana TaxID=7141 RepID=A0ACC0K9G8_CHOFU|nr:hypothetical protein MSG28_013790 [Choristoneura fumiferana]